MLKLLLFSAVIIVIPLGFALAKVDPQTGFDDENPNCPAQKNVAGTYDPNEPCHDAARALVNERESSAVADARMVRVHQDECGGCHAKQGPFNVANLTENTQTVEDKADERLKSSVPSGAPTAPADEPGSTSGRDNGH